MNSEKTQSPELDLRLILEQKNNCSIKRTLDIVGESWTLLILREASWGVRRFQDFQTFLGIPRAVLSERLEKLVEYGIFKKTPYKEPGARTRYQYEPTKAGIRLLPVLMALSQWGDEHLGKGSSRMIDKATREEVFVKVVSKNGDYVPVERVRPVVRR
ncbi:winged helix-turn-helix transcriptional regulator [Bradyrhizobium sp. RDM4]|uniref:winged helix-turn-helix transcriptional regulator n=1 Tax=Bradyrhizobium sp. RDM4 TaxID=3378765 RepID=UPI0038FC84E3